MRTRLVKLCGWLAIGGSLALSAWADNNCIENPSYGTPYLVQPGTLAPGYVLTPTNISVCVGQLITPPTVTNLAMTNGLEKYYVTYLCRASCWLTSSINYTLTNYFVPQIPANNWVTGTYYYTGIVVASSSFSPITNILGMITINVTGPPVIVSQPSSQTVIQGSNVIFTVGVSANSTTPLNYQWYFNAMALDATNATLALDNVQTDDAGNYYVIVTNSLGSVTSSIVTLTVFVPPTITTQPANQTVVAGSSATFSVIATATGCDGPFTYQWLYNGADITSIITTMAGNGSSGYSGDGGPAMNASLNTPSGIAMDASGNLYIADTWNCVIRKVAANGIITTVAGICNSWDYSGDSGPATNASLMLPEGVAVDTSGNLYIADTENYVIRKVDTNGIITTVAGNGSSGYADDGGPATNASLSWPYSVAVDTSGNLYIVDSDNDVIRKVDTNGIITTVAGNGNYDYSGDGSMATNASLAYPFGVAVDTSGNLYIVDSDNDVIRKVDTNGIITTVAGNGSSGYAGNGGPATNASLMLPEGVAVDTSGNLYIVDSDNDVIRKVDTNGIITTVAGNGSLGYSGDGGPATSASLKWPEGVAVDASDNLYIADTCNNVIREVNPLQGGTITLSIVTTNEAGTYQVIVTSPCGSVTSSNVTLTVLTPPVITQQPANVGVIQGSNATFIVTVASQPQDGPLGYQWWFNATSLAGVTNASLTITNVQTTNTGAYFVVVSNAGGSVTSSNAILTLVAAIVTTQPANQTVTQGSNATFSVTAIGSAPLSYQWQKNGSILTNNSVVSGANTSTLTLTGVRLTDAGLYSVVISNALGTVNSHYGVLRVWPGFASGVVGWGDNTYGQISIPAGLTNVVAIAAGTWYGLALKGDGTVAAWGKYQPTGDLTSLTNEVAVAAGDYHILALNNDGIVTALGYDGSIGNAEADIPTGLTNVVAIAAGNDYSLALKNDGTVVAWGSDFYGFGATRVPSGLTNVVAITASPYGGALALKSDGTVVGWGNFTLSPAFTNVIAIDAGDDFSLALKSDGTVVESAGWWGEGEPAGLTNVVAIAAGSYHSLALKGNGTVVAWDHVVETNVPNSLTNVVAIAGGGDYDFSLALGSLPPSIITQPQSQTVPIGNNAMFSVIASGTLLNYQWYFKNAPLSGATGATLIVTNVQNANAGNYFVTVGNKFGSVTSSNAVLTATLVSPVITTQPASQTTFQGNSPIFSVTASGTMPFGYQWYFNGTNIIGATGPSLTLPNVQINQTGNYSVVVTNIVGSTASSNASLIVLVVLITTQPANQTILRGSNATFSVTALSNVPLSYQWQFNGINVVGATNTVLTVSNVGPNQVGAYSVLITNVYGSVVSSNAWLNIYDIAVTLAGSPTFRSIAYDRLAQLFDAGYISISNSANIVSFQGTMSAQVPPGETNLGTTSVAAPKASSSSTAIYSLTARPVASGGSPFSPSIPFCRLASALIRLASIAKASPPTSPSRMQRCRTVSKTRRSRSLSRKRPCRFFEKVE